MLRDMVGRNFPETEKEEIEKSLATSPWRETVGDLVELLTFLSLFVWTIRTDIRCCSARFWVQTSK